jgi:nucleoside-diphosphate-sugar epimerase
MDAALIGHTGFVGGNLARQFPFTATFDSASIARIGDRAFDLVVCAAPSAVKWLANKDPERDRAIVRSLLEALAPVRTERFVLISTVDVYPDPVGVDEETPVDPACAMPYGRHRFELELGVRDRFGRTLVVRLPQLYGWGLKKNFVYDLIHSNALHLTDHRSVLQFYDVSRLWTDVEAAQRAGLDLVNLSAEPMSCAAIARDVFDREFDNVTTAGPVYYDMRSCRLAALGINGPYVLGHAENVANLRRFVRDHRTVPPA